MKTLRVTLADLEGIPHATAAAATAVTVTAAYTGPVILTDGTIIPTAIKAKTVGSSGVVNFSVHASDDPAVREDHQGFAITVTAQIRLANGSVTAFKRTVKPLESMGSVVQLGDLTEAEGLPPQWVSVADFVDAIEAQVGEAVSDATAALDAAESAQSSASSAASSAANAVTLAQQAQAAALEVPDANMAAAISNDATDTAQAGDARWLKGTRDANNTIRSLVNTNDTSAGSEQNILIAAPSPGSPHTINGTATLRMVLGGYDSTMDAALAATMIQGMHASIDAGSTHGLIVGGSYQQLIDADYSAAIAGTNLTVGGGDVPSNYSVALGGSANTVRGYFSAAVAGRQNQIESRAGLVAGEQNATYGDHSLVSGRENTLGSSANPTWGQYAAIVGGYQNNLGTTANGQFAAVVGGRGHDVQAEYAGVVGGYGAKPRFRGAQAWAMGYANEVGDAQMERAVFWGVSTTTGVKQLLVNNTERLVLPDNTTWGFEGFVTGRRASDGETGVWKVTGAISRGSGVGSTVILGEPTVEPVGTTTGGAEAWSITAVADNTWGALALRGRSPSGGTVNWSAGIDLTEVTA